jgi:hypothetical protein
MEGNLNLKTIFGIKLKRVREGKGLTLAELSQKAQVSTSYLAEIEAGKKYPKADKILLLAQGLGCSYDDLISTKMDREFDGLRELLSTPGVRDFPFEMFGVPAGDLMKLLTRSPSEVAALLRALHDIARQYNIGVEHFLHAALRSYQELTSNYYEELEAEAEGFAQAHLQGRAEIGQGLREWVQLYCEMEVDEETLGRRAALGEFRAVFCRRPGPRILLNPQLTESQRAFVLAREVGYRALGLRARSLTTPPDREDSFEQVLNDFKASYFAGALLLPRERLCPDIEALLGLTSWSPQPLLHMLDRYQVTPETLMYRLSQLLPGRFGLRPHFLKFESEGGRVRLVKQLNLSGLPVPAGTGGEEHHCRRWVSPRILAAMEKDRGARAKEGRPLVWAQRSRHVDDEQAEYLCLGLGMSLPLRPVLGSLTLGFRVDEGLLERVRFAADPGLPVVRIGGTCERCPLPAGECVDRVAPPTRWQGRLQREARRHELKLLTGE